MAKTNDIFIPTSPVNIHFKPLNKGMFRDTPADEIPKEGLYTAKNYIVGLKGPRRRPGWDKFASDAGIDSNSTPMVDFVPAWLSSGTQFNALLTERYLYLVGLASVTPYYWTYSTGTVSVGGSNVFGSTSAAVWSAGTYLTNGDVIIFSSITAAGVTEEAEIATYPTASTMTLTSNTSNEASFSTGTAYTIRRTFTPSDEYSMDAMVIENEVVIADHKRSPYKFDNLTLSNYSAAISSQGYIPGCLAFFSDRMWMGNIIERTAGVDDHKRSRIRWSDTTSDPRSFSAADYNDLPYQPGALLRLVPLGNMLIAYFQDAIYYGTRTQIVDLPYRFEKIETGGIGLVGPKAIVSYLGGHFFIGQDDIYYLPSDPRTGPQRIGSMVISATIQAVSDQANLQKARVTADPQRERIVFSFPTTGTTLINHWSFSYRAKAWSYETYEADMLATPLISITLAWSDLTGTWTTLGGTYATWDAMKGSAASTRDLFLGQATKLYKLGATTIADSFAGNIDSVIETGDLDLGEPDLEKTFHEIHVKFASAPSTTTSFNVSSSRDEGVTWDSKGTLTIAADKREGFLGGLRVTESAPRFRLSTSSAVEPYVINEITFRLRPRGRDKGNTID